MNLTIINEPSDNDPIHRSVTLSNDNWLVLSQCVESFAETYRAKHAQIVCTYVTRGQLEEATTEATKMNELLQQLDKLQAKLV